MDYLVLVFLLILACLVVFVVLPMLAIALIRSVMS